MNKYLTYCTIFVLFAVMLSFPVNSAVFSRVNGTITNSSGIPVINANVTICQVTSMSRPNYTCKTNKTNSLGYFITDYYTNVLLPPLFNSSYMNASWDGEYRQKYFTPIATGDNTQNLKTLPSPYCKGFSQNISDLMTLIAPSYDEVFYDLNVPVTVFVNTTGQDCWANYSVYVDENAYNNVEWSNLVNMNESYLSGNLSLSYNITGYYPLYCSVYYPSVTEDNMVSNVCGRVFLNVSVPITPSPPSVEDAISQTNNTLISIFVVTLLISLLMALAFTFIPALRENHMAMMVIGAGLVICAIIMLVVSLKMLNFV